MRYRGWPWVLTVLAFAALPAAAVTLPTAEECQYVLVTDPCQNDLLIFDIGEEFLTHNIPLGGAGGYEIGGVDFAEVPGYRDQYSFVVQGPFLRVIKHELAVVWRTIDVGLAVGFTDLRLQRVHASGPVTIGSSTRYPLYMSGYVLTDTGTEPVYVVLDQEALLAYEFDYATITIGSGAVCVDGVPCVGAALDVSASAAFSSGPLQEAFVTVLNYEGVDRYQRIYRLTLGANGAFSVSLDPWNDEGTPFGGSAHRSIGLDYDSAGLLPYGLFQTTGVETDLLTGEASCALPGSPTDVEVWGPGAGGSPALYHFVTSKNPAGDLLLGFPDGECPVGGGPNTLSLAVGAQPRGVGISSDTDSPLWVYTANKDHGITAVELEMADGGPVVLQSLDVPFEGCPMDIAFRDPAITACNAFEDQPDTAEPMDNGPGVDDPDDPDPCPPGSTDPQCIDPGGPQEVCEVGTCGMPTPTGRR